MSKSEMNHFGVRLARCNYAPDCSAGWWLVREVPGMVVLAEDERWIVRSVSDVLPYFFPRYAQVWGEAFSDAPARQLVRRAPELQRMFRSRSAALLAITAALHHSSPSAIGTMV